MRVEKDKMTKREAIKIILSDKKSFSTTLNYAVNYCNSALNMSGHELDAQCLYILVILFIGDIHRQGRLEMH